MIEASNKHWEAVEHDLNQSMWASHLIVSDVAGRTMNAAEEKDFSDYLTDSGSSGVKKLKVRNQVEIGHIGLSLLFESVRGDRDIAISTSTSLAFGALHHAGFEIPELLFNDLNLTTENHLLKACTAGKAKDIRDNLFRIDPEYARPMFFDVRDSYATFDGLLAGIVDL